MVNSLWRCILYTTEGSIGLVMNSFVAIVMLSSKSLMSMDSSKFILNQSLIDAVASALILTSHFNIGNNYGVEIHTEGDNWWDEILCRLWVGDLFMWGSFYSSTINLVVLTIERYIKIVHPMGYISKIHPWMIKTCLVLPWILGPMYYIVLYTISAQVKDGICKVHYWPSYTMAQIIGIISFCVQFFVPLTVMIFCYGRILVTIRNRNKNLQKYGTDNSTQGDTKITTVSGNGTDNSSTVYVKDETSSSGMSTDHSSGQSTSVAIISSSNKKQLTKNDSKDDKLERNVIKTLILVCVGFCLCWLWNQCLFFLLNIGLLTTIFKYGSPFYQFSIIAAYLNCCVNPFIYIVLFDKFKIAAKGFFRCGKTAS